MPGVPLAGCVLRPGRTINCEPLRREGCGGRSGGEGRGTLYCCRFTRHAYLTPAFPFPSSLIPFRSHPPQSLCFLATNRRTPPSPPRALSIYRALISAPRITPVRVRSHTRWIDTRDSKEPRLDRGGAQCPQREREREDEAGCLCNMNIFYIRRIVSSLFHPLIG